MNRSERRNIKKGKIPESLINRTIYDKVAKDVLNYTTSGIFAALAVTLHDKYGWGHIRVKRLLDEVEKQFECVLSDHISVNDLKQIVKDELDIDII